MIVVDASVLANALADHSRDGAAARSLLREHRELAAPDLADVETVAVLRRHWVRGALTDEQFGQAVADLTQLPVERYPARLLLRRAYQLRSTVTAYDACYVALAEVLEVPLATGDARLTRAPGPTCDFLLLGAA